MENITSSEQIDYYKTWLEQEGIPVIREWYIDDVMKVPLKPWKRTGGLGTYLDLVGSEARTGSYVCEIPPGGSLKPEKHLFEEFIYILSGSGSTSIWNKASPKQTFNWQQGSLFSPPLNCWHQLFNTQRDEPVRFLAVIGAPVFMNLFHNWDFTFNNDFVFKDRYAGESDYFSGKGKFTKIIGIPVWEANFIKDVRTFEVPSFEQMGAEARLAPLEMSQNTMESHISEFAPGTYKKAHRHAGGAHVVIISGKGYSLVWSDIGQPMKRFDWHEGSIIVPPEGWFHQHFITGTTPARHLALRWSGRKYRFDRRWRMHEDIKKGGDQIEYTDEDPQIRKVFEQELAKEGLKSKMDVSLYKG